MTHPSEPRKINDHDTDLVSAVQSGRLELLPELVRRYESALYRFGLKICGKHDEAEDLVQDTFLNVLKYLKHFRHETRFRNWLYRIAASACIKKHRRSRYAPTRELSLDEFMPGQEHAAGLHPPSWASLPIDQLLNEELGRQLGDSILQLPEKYRIVLVLRDLEHFSTSETARILSLSPANVKVRLHRARLFVREQLKAYFDEENTSTPPPAM